MIKMPQPQPNCQPIRYCWDAEKVKNLIRLRAELSPLFTGKRNASKYAWTVVEQELNVPLPLSKIIKKWNNLLQEYKAIKLSEEPKRREWPFFTLMDLYFSDQVNDPTLRLFSSTKTFCDTIDDKEDYSLTTALATVAAAQNALSGGTLLDMGDLKSELKLDQNEADLCDTHEPKYCHNNNNNSNLNNNNNNSTNNNNNNNDSNVNNNNNNNSSNNNNNQNTNNNNRNSNNSSSNNNLSNYGQVKPIQTQHSHIDYDDVASDYGNDLENSSTNDILNRANEHHNIAQYLLSWNNFHGNMCKGFHNLQKDGQMVDVTIAAGGKIFKAHKLVLSVCSPYFQKIFLENPSTHPILFMTDVNSNYMAGLLDFMYSGQVNVKYDDLPSFLKVAEAMQIKGLHTESTKDDQEDKEQTGSTSLFQSQLQQQQIQRDQIHQQLQQQAAHQHQQQQQQQQRTNTPVLMSNKNRVQQPPTKYVQSPKHTSSQYRQGLQDQSYMQLQTLNLSQNRNLNKDLQTKSMLNEDIDSHSNNNNNNNNSSNNNTPSQISNNSNSNNNFSNNNASKYVIQQTNISNKLLDNQKYPKYYSKRKLLAQYEQEMRNQKRCRPSTLQEDTNRNYKQTLNLINNNDDSIDNNTSEQKSGLLTNIKLEPDRLSLQSDNLNNNNNNNNNSSNSNNNNNNTDDDNNNNNNKNNNNSNYFNSNNINDSNDNNIHTFTLKQQQQQQHSNHDSNDGLNLKTTPDQTKLNPSIKSS